MMITRTEKQIAADQVTQSYLDLENQIMQNIIRHIKDYKKPIDSDDWLMQKLAEVGGLNKENIKLIAKATGANVKQVEAMCNEVADTVVQRVDDLPDLRDIEKPKKTQTKNVKRAVKTVYDQAKDSLNKCNTNMLYAAQSSYQQLVQNLVSKAKEVANKQDLLDIIGSHATAEAVGSESRGQAIRSALKAFNDKGIPAFVDKAGRQWTPEAYVSMTLRTTAGNIATEAMNARMDDLGLNLIQVSSHSGARPKCAKDQGKIFDKNGGSGTVEDINGKKIKYYPFSSSSYGEPDGLFGINCGHHGKPFIPGVSRSRWEPTKDLEENNEEYKKMQMQRGLEREVRNQKRLCSLYKEAGDDEGFEEAAVVLKAKEYKLDDYVSKNGLVRRRDREQVYGFDRYVSAKSVGTAQTHYKNWAKSIGAESGPKRLAGYYKLKYNKTKESDIYTWYVKAVNKGNISPLVKYDKFKEYHYKFEKVFTGVIASDGSKIEGITPHFTDRMFGTHGWVNEPERGKERFKDFNHKAPSVEDIMDALKNPEKVGTIRTRSDGKRSKVYYGSKANVSYNPDSNELIQTEGT